MNMTDFREMPYERPDLKTYAEKKKAAAESFRNAGSYREVRDAYFTLQEEDERVETLFSLAYVRNTIDTRDPFYEGEVKWLEEEMARMIPLGTRVSLSFPLSALAV